MSQPDGGPSLLAWKLAWEDCGRAAAAAANSAPGGRQRKEKSYSQNELCALDAKCMNKYVQINTRREWISIPCLHIYCRALA